jgi:crotonobetainyl-CoA:carnitine CoA-transferase CaiB-like acyl-CoA transferase
MAAHDLNYLAFAGLLSLTGDRDGAPVMPQMPIADIAAGTYPALINVLLALLQRQRTGKGCHLDISMTDNLFVLAYWGLADGFVNGAWPTAGSALTTGASPRYQIYRTADGGYLSAGPIEQRFWEVFCRLIELDPALRDDARDPAATRAGVAARIAAYPAAHWRRVFEGQDACCAIVANLADAVRDPHVAARKIFDRRVGVDDETIPALPVPIDPALRDSAAVKSAPRLGADSGLVGMGS